MLVVVSLLIYPSYFIILGQLRFYIRSVTQIIESETYTC